MCVCVIDCVHYSLTIRWSGLVCRRPCSAMLLLQTMSSLPMSVTFFICRTSADTSGRGTRQYRYWRTSLGPIESTAPNTLLCRTPAPGVAYSSTSFGWGKGGNVTSAGWQVTLCDPMWHVSSRGGVATLRTATHLLLTYPHTHKNQCSHSPFQNPRSIFPGPRRKPAMFKFRDKQQLPTIHTV